jgi:hypothetical protein
VSARTRDGALLGSGNWKVEQFGQGGCSSPMHGFAHRHLDRFQIEMPGFATAGKDNVQDLIYFAGNFFLDRSRRFFSWADGEDSSTGRSEQICSFTSNSSSLSCRKCSRSATSRCALAKAATEENVSVMVLPFTLRVNR